MEYTALPSPDQIQIARQRLHQLEAQAFERELVLLELDALVAAGIQTDVHAEAAAGHQSELLKLEVQIGALRGRLEALLDAPSVPADQAHAGVGA